MAVQITGQADKTAFESTLLSVMDAPIFGLIFGGLMTAMVVIPRVMAWIAGLILIFQQPEAIERRSARSLSQFFLHSAPWLVAITIGGTYYIASLSEPHLLWALIGGFALGAALLASALVVGYARRRKPVAPVPLTPELLARKRRRFLWTCSLLWGGLVFGWLLYEQMLWIDMLSVYMLVIGFGGGWLWSWFMWQMFSAQLLAREEQRKFWGGRKEKEWAP